jgi:hypothetical protein
VNPRPLPRTDDFASLRERAINMGGDGRPVTIVATGCAYSCCGRPWTRRDYEAQYTGYIDNYEERDGERAGTFMLYSQGIGTISYVIACRDYELQEVL